MRISFVDMLIITLQTLLGLQPTDRRVIAEPETRHVHRLYRYYTNFLYKTSL